MERTMKTGSTPVEAGKIADALGGFFGKMFKTIFTDPKKDGFSVKPGDVDSTTGAEIWTITTGEGHEYKMKSMPIGVGTDGEKDPDFDNSKELAQQMREWKKDPRFNLHFKGKDADGKVWEEKKENIPYSQMKKVITEVTEAHYSLDGIAEGTESARHGDQDLFEESLGTDASSSKRLRATFKRVLGAKEDRIDLVKVHANYDATIALKDLETILGDDDFVSQIGEDEATFDILDQGNDGYEVNPCGELEAVCSEPTVEDSIDAMLVAGYNLYNNALLVYFNTIPKPLQQTRNGAENLLWPANEFIRSLNELRVEKCGSALHPAEYVSKGTQAELSVITDDESGRRVLRELVRGLVSTIELYHCNMAEDVQHFLMDWLRKFYKEMDLYLGGVSASVADGAISLLSPMPGV